MSDHASLRPRAKAGHIKDFGEGRRCASVGCHTVLSRYNGGLLCWVHDNLSRSPADPVATNGQVAALR